MKGPKILQKFRRDKRALELDYMLSLFIFIISLGFTFLVLTQYLDAKRAQVSDVNNKLASLSILDDLTGSPGWMGGRSDWERYVSRVNLAEKINHGEFLLGLRKNDRFFGTNLVIPAAADPLMQSASQSAILSAVGALRAKGVLPVEVAGYFRPVLTINTSTANASISISGTADNATTHVGSVYVAGEKDLYVTDTQSDGVLLYDTVVIGNRILKSGSKVNLGGRNFTVHDVDQDEVLLAGQVGGGFLLPCLDDYEYSLARQELESRGIKYDSYAWIMSGVSSNLEYTLFSKAPDKFKWDLTDLSIDKIRALRDAVPYALAKGALGVPVEFHLRITRKADGAVVLNYGPATPADTESAERDVDVEGVPCTIRVDVWQV